MTSLNPIDTQIRAEVQNVLRQVIDPEVGINIVDLGLVYGIEVEDGCVHVAMTMTSPACPLGTHLKTTAENAVRQQVSQVRSVVLELVWAPAWHPDMVSVGAREQLGTGPGLLGVDPVPPSPEGPAPGLLSRLRRRVHWPFSGKP